MDAVYYNSPKKNRAKKIFFAFFFLLLSAGLAYGGFFAWKIYAVGKKISFDNANQPSFLQTVKSLADQDPQNITSADPDRINILLLGIGGKENPAPNLTDTIMIASINRKTDKVAFISIPRDLYVTVPKINYPGKINTIYQLELGDKTKNQDEKMQPLLDTVKDITDLNMDYYVVLNFAGFRKIIDDIGGINIMNDRDIFDARYPGPNYSYLTFELEKGFHHLDGATALMYARERHNDPQGDFGRAARQQQVIQAAKSKIFSMDTLFNPVALSNLLDTLGNNIITNITPDEIGAFLALSKKLDTQNITNVVFDAWNKDSLLKIVHVPVASTSFSALTPRVGNWSETRETAQNAFDLNTLKRKRESIAAEDANIAIINKSGNNLILSRIKNLLSDNLNYKNVAIVDGPDKNSADTSAVFDLTNGLKPFTANELVTKLPAAISYEAGSAPAIKYSRNKFDFVVVVGKDLIDKYNMEEGTISDLNNSRDSEESQGFNKN